MKDQPTKGLCHDCQHRADSEERVRAWVARGSKGVVCDPAPKVQCKDHAGYGLDGTREYCLDFKPKA